MPTYTFKRKSTGQEWTDIISISAREEVLKDPDITQLIVPNGGFVAGTGMSSDDGLRDILKEIAKVSPGHNMDIR